MRKIIIPMASPATVSVTHDDGLPIKGRAMSIRAGTSSSGNQSVRLRGNSAALDGFGGDVGH